MVIEPTELTAEQKANENYVKEVNAEILRLVNEERKAVGLSHLNVYDEGIRFANDKSLDMLSTGVLSHKDEAGMTTLDYMNIDGIHPRYWAENIAYISKGEAKATAKGLMDMWMKSPGHKANILSNQAESISIGTAFSDNLVYATQIFVKQ